MRRRCARRIDSPAHALYLTFVIMKKSLNKKPIARHVSGWMTLAVASTCAMHASVSHAEDKTAVLDAINVTGSASPAYKPETASIGPLGDKSIQDTPYTVNVIPAELPQNQQLKSVREAFRYLPSVQGENIRPQTRGLQAGVVQNTRIDGMNIAATTDYPIEQFDRIEVLNGLAGALYGPANPAGTFNYVLKRPTNEPLRRISVGYASQTSRSLGVDLGGYFDEDKKIGYRVNLLDDIGEGYVDDSSLKRKMISIALDFHLSRDTVIETNASRYRYTALGFPGTFAIGNATTRFPAAPDPKQVGYGQPWAGDDNVTETYSARIKHKFNEDWSLTAGLLQQSSDRASTVPTNTLTNNAGAYTVTTATTTFTLDRILSNIIALNGRVNTGDVMHDLVFSTTGFDWKRYQPYTTGKITLLPSTNLNDPHLYGEPTNFPDFDNRYNSVTTRQQSLTVGDTISFAQKWSAGLFVSQSWIDAYNYDKTGKTTSSKKVDGVSTNATLSYKPQDNMTLYGSYADSLQQGEFAPTGAKTADGSAALSPYRSKQWELGYKVGLGRIDIGAALFRVERPFAFTTAGIFAVQGTQVNRGVELTANGAVTNNLTAYSGLMYLDPQLEDTGNAATADKQIMGLSRLVANVLLDYRVASVPGLFVNFNVNHATDREGDSANTYKIPGYTVTDIGARYTTKVGGYATTWRVGVTNLTDKRYWSNVTPTGQNGYLGSTTDFGSATLGAPRMVRASMQVDF
jgi:iron complex outermembrane receptor protein